MASEVSHKPISRPGAEIVSARAAVLALTAIVIAGFAVRWIGVGEQSLTHPEAYIPGIALSAETRVPPPRDGFFETLSWHFHDEPHPVGYYMAMRGWTAAFGDSETALRTPSILFGAGSIVLIYALGAALYGRFAGLAASALLAFDGFHVFWSGIARMYAPGCFFGLLATLLFVRIVARERPGAALSAGYVLSILAAVQMTELNWAIFAGHVLWAAWFAASRKAAPSGRGGFAVSRIVALQVAAFALAAPALLHAVYTARGGAAAPPSPDFALHYFTFGFLLEPDELHDPVRSVNAVVVGAGLAVSLALLAAGVMSRSGLMPPPAAAAPAPLQLVALLALLSSAFMFWLSTIAEKRGAILAAVSMLPILSLAWLRLAGAVRPAIAGAAPSVERWIARADPFMLIIAGLGVAAPLAIILLSLWKPVTESRPFIVFIPYLLVLAAAGLAELWRRRPLFIAASAATAALLVVSVAHAEKRVTSPRDYKGLAAAILAEAREGDLFLIRRWDWRDAPVTYYLPHEGIVGENFAERVTASSRVWTVRWFDQEPSRADREMDAALKGHVWCARVSARGGFATLYVPRADAPSCRIVR